MKSQPTVLDLFSGCGGLSLGSAQAGLQSSIAFDFDSDLTSSFERNHLGTRLVNADIANLSHRDIEAAVGRVDVIIGGPPCQGFSSIGKRQPDDPRRMLLGHYFRLIKELSPSYFVMENVKGLMYTDARPELDDCLSGVAANYDFTGPVILDAADFGAPTKRPRLFVIGWRKTCADGISLEDIERAKACSAKVTVRDAISDLVDPIALPGYPDKWKIGGRLTPSAYATRLRSVDQTFTGNQRTKHGAETISRFANVVQGATDSVGRHPRLSWEGQCPTLRAGTGSDRGSFQSVRPIHPEENRVITVREAARLQGFPDWFEFHPTIWHSFRMIGNSVSPIISEKLMAIVASKIFGTDTLVAAE